MSTDDLFLVYYCHENCKPFQNIMRLPKNEAFLLAEKMTKENPNATAFYRFADFENYYSLRLQTERLLYENFVRLGGKPKEKHPLFFVLQGCKYLEHWFGNGPTYKIKLSEICPDTVSFTLGDSCAQYEKTESIRQLTERQLPVQLSNFNDSIENYLNYISKNYRYIEVQLWESIEAYRDKFRTENLEKRAF